MANSNSKNSESSTHQKEYNPLYWLIITRSLWLSRFKKTVFVQRSLTTWYDPTGLRLFNPFCWRTIGLWLDFGTYFIAVSQTNLEFLEQTFIFEDKYLKSRQNQSYQTLIIPSVQGSQYGRTQTTGVKRTQAAEGRTWLQAFRESVRSCRRSLYSLLTIIVWSYTFDYQPFLISWPAWWTTPMTHWTLKILFIIRATG